MVSSQTDGARAGGRSSRGRLDGELRWDGFLRKKRSHGRDRKGEPISFRATQFGSRVPWWVARLSELSRATPSQCPPLDRSIHRAVLGTSLPCRLLLVLPL